MLYLSRVPHQTQIEKPNGGDPISLPPSIIISPDSALLKFADSLLAFVDVVRRRWQHVNNPRYVVLRSAYDNTGAPLTTSPDKIRAHALQDNPSHENEGPLPMPLASWDSFRPGDLLLCVKGAPEILLGRCSHVISGTDQSLFLTYAAHEHIAAIREQWDAQGRHVLLLACCVVPHDALPKEIDPY
jgi:sodium/potassium-transporting ATPase subunit alpha